MKTLLLLRHAKSSWKFRELADHDRPLNRRGRRDAPRMGELLRERGLIPDRVLSSTAVRALTTARLCAEAAGFSGEVEPVGDLYGAGPSGYLDAVRGLPAETRCALLVGHNPTMASLVAQLGGESHVVFPTAALACFELAVDSWRDLDAGSGARLAGLWRPKEL